MLISDGEWSSIQSNLPASHGVFRRSEMRLKHHQTCSRVCQFSAIFVAFQEGTRGTCTNAGCRSHTDRLKVVRVD